MTKRMLFGTVLMVALASLTGCSGADDPQVADAPAYTPPSEPPEQPKIPGRQEEYGASSKYQESMERMYNQ